MSDYHNYSDEELVYLLGEGDKTAFSVIYERYWHSLWIFSVRSLKTEEEARDLVQDVFTVVWEKHETINIHTSLKAFLYKTTLHRIIKQVDRTKNTQAFYNKLKTYTETTFSSDDSPTAYRLAERELISRFEKAVGMMPAKMKEAYVASRSEQLSYQEIADRMGISRESVRTHIKHALKQLRKQLSNFLIFF